MESLQIALDVLEKVYLITKNAFLPALLIFFLGFLVAVVLAIFLYRKNLDWVRANAKGTADCIVSMARSEEKKIINEANIKAATIVSNAKKDDRDAHSTRVKLSMIAQAESDRIHKHLEDKKKKLDNIREIIRNTEDKNVRMKDALQKVMIHTLRIRRELDAAKAGNREVSVKEIKKACNRILSLDEGKK